MIRCIATIACRRNTLQHSATKATPANQAMPVQWKAPLDSFMTSLDVMVLFISGDVPRWFVYDVTRRLGFFLSAWTYHAESFVSTPILWVRDIGQRTGHYLVLAFNHLSENSNQLFQNKLHLIHFMSGRPSVLWYLTPLEKK